ncbi:MAG: hypothetical protein LBG88_00645 [Christensenellaceae bacterium]|jgi:hypothetical protein|nr:hypothetical protein [Christensenellaceae bacterium]
MLEKRKITAILETETGGKSYKARKYSLDSGDYSAISFDEREKSNVWQKYGETEKYKTWINLTQKAKELSHGDSQILTYFLDGSRKVYKVDNVGYDASGNRMEIYPIIAGQIGVGCCKRKNRILKQERCINEIVLAVPEKANADRKEEFFSQLALKISQTCNQLKRLGIKIGSVLGYKTNDIKKDGECEDRATAKVQDRMIEKEKEMVALFVSQGKLDQNNYLVKDGSLEYSQPVYEKDITKEEKKKQFAKFKQNYNFVLGASKHFNPSVCCDINGKPNPGFIADLPLYSRTPVARYHNEFCGDVDFAVWYIRLQGQEKTRTPFDGILKVEKMLVTSEEIENGIDSELVDTLSAYIINERNPVCYGSDLRWANHIYPMYMTETYVKSKYISAESFLQLF